MNAPPSAQVYEPIHDDDFAQTPDDLIHPDLLAQSRQSVTIPQVRQEELVSMLQEYFEHHSSPGEESERDHDQTPGNKQRRAYKRVLPQQISTALEIRRAEALHYMRCVYLCNFNCEDAKQHVLSIFSDIAGDAKGSVLEYFIKRCRRNASNWQHLLIRNFTEHVELLLRDETNKRYRNEKKASVLNDWLSRQFNLDVFSQVFSFILETIDLARSGIPVKKWCKKLGRRIKLHMDYLAKDPSSRPEKDSHNREAIIFAIKDLGVAEKYNRLRPTWKQLVRKVVVPKLVKSKVVVKKFASLDEDEDCYIPSDDDNDE